MKVYQATYYDGSIDEEAEDVLVAQFEDEAERNLYHAYKSFAGLGEWVKRNLRDYELSDDDIFYYLDPSPVGTHLAPNTEIENIVSGGDMLVIGKEF